MREKIIGILVCMLLITTALPAIEAVNNGKDISNEEFDLMKNRYGEKLSKSEEIIFEEDFETEWEPDSNGDMAPPYRWEVEHTTTELNGGIPCWWHQYEESGEHYAGLWWGNQPQDEWLITPDIDLRWHEGARIEFLTWNYGLHPGFWEGDYIEVSVDGGSNWDVLANLYDLAPSGGQFFGENMSFDLSSYCGNESVLVAFHRVTDDPNTNYGWWMIDDVIVTLVDPIPFPYVDLKEVSGGFGINVLLKNFGDAEATDVEWSITIDAPFMFFGGEKSGNISSIPPGDEVTVKTGFIFGLGLPVVTISVDLATMIFDKNEGLLIGLFFMKLPNFRKCNYAPASNWTIDWVNCTIKVGANDTKGNPMTGRSHIQVVKKNGEIYGGCTNKDATFINGYATVSVSTQAKNYLKAGGWVNVRGAENP